MRKNGAELVMALIGITSVALLIVYGLTATAGSAQTDVTFWLLTAAFVVYIAWDVRRHLRKIRSP